MCFAYLSFYSQNCFTIQFIRFIQIQTVMTQKSNIDKRLMQRKPFQFRFKLIFHSYCCKTFMLQRMQRLCKDDDFELNQQLKLKLQNMKIPIALYLTLSGLSGLDLQLSSSRPCIGQSPLRQSNLSTVAFQI